MEPKNKETIEKEKQIAADIKKQEKAKKKTMKMKHQTDAKVVEDSAGYKKRKGRREGFQQKKKIKIP